MRKQVVVWADSNNSKQVHRYQRLQIQKLVCLHGLILQISAAPVPITDTLSDYIIISSSQLYKAQSSLILENSKKKARILGVIIYCNDLKKHKQSFNGEGLVCLVTNSFKQVVQKIINLAQVSDFLFAGQCLTASRHTTYEDEHDRYLIQKIDPKILQSIEFQNPQDYEKRLKAILELFRLDFDAENNLQLTKKKLIEDLTKALTEKGGCLLHTEVQSIQKCKSTKELVKVCIYLYTLEKGRLYSRLNIALRNLGTVRFQAEFKTLKLFCVLLLLNCCFFYNDAEFTDTVYRYTDFEPDESTLGSIITVCNFYSASRTPDLASFKNKKTKIVIETFDHSSSADSLAFFNYFLAGKFSAFQDQQEVIFAPFTRFKVIKISKQKAAQTVVYLKQIADNRFLKKIYDINFLESNQETRESQSRQLNYQFKYQKLLKRQSKENSVEMAKVYQNLGMIYANSENYKLAQSFFSRSLQIYEKLDVQKMVVSSLNNMGLVLAKKQKQTDAMIYFKRAQALLKNSPSRSLVSIINNKASVYETLGQLEVALKTYEQALQVCSVYYPKYHLVRAKILNNIGYMRESLGRYEDAIKDYQKAMEIFIEVSGKDSGDISVCLENLSSINIRMGKYEQAVQNLVEAIQIETRSRGDKSSALINLYGSLVNIYNKQEKYQQGIKTLKLAIEISSVVNGNTHLQTALLYQNLGSLYQSAGEPDLGLNYLQKSLEVYELVYKDKNSQVIEKVAGNIQQLKLKIKQGLFK